MCGIFGSPTITPSVRRMLPYLGIEMQTRGRDAWGASNGAQVLKRVGPIVESWAQFQDQIAEWGQGIFHTRGASMGSPKAEENAHPFSFRKEDGSEVIGIHNGLVANHKELDAKYSRSCAVDSEHLWMHRAAGLPWSDIRGWGNLAWWEMREGEQQLNLLRFNADALKVCKLKQGEYVFASEMKPIATIATMLGNPPDTWFSIDERHHYYFKRDAEAPGGVRLMRSGEPINFARPEPTPVRDDDYTPFLGYRRRELSRPTHTYNPNVTYCYKCNTTRVGENEMLCYTCLRFLADMYNVCGKDDWTE